MVCAREIVARGDLGECWGCSPGRPVSTELRERFPATIELAQRSNMVLPVYKGASDFQYAQPVRP